MLLVACLLGLGVTSVVVGNVADIVRNANPGLNAQKEAEGLISAFLHNRTVYETTKENTTSHHIEPALRRRIRAQISDHFEQIATTLPLADIFAILPQLLQEELAKDLNFISHKVFVGAADNRQSKTIPGCFSHVPFFMGLHSTDLIRIGCRLKVQLATAPEIHPEWGVPYQGLIMQEGHRGTEMFIVEHGEVQIETGLQGIEDGQPHTFNHRVHLGILHANDIFGELAVLVQESVGMPLKRKRSAYALCTRDPVCKLLTLTYDDVQELRAESAGIDQAVRKAIMALKDNMPSLFDAGDESADEREDKVRDLQKAVAALQRNVQGITADME